MPVPGRFAPPGYPPDETDPGSGDRQADHTVQHEFKSVQALRGRESSAKAKWRNQGWEFVSENRGALRTELNFRRAKPKTLGSHLLGMVTTLRRPQPKARSVLVASCALILVAGIIGVVVGTQGGGDTTPKLSAAQATASTAPPAEPTVNDEQVLTADHSDELAALLAVPDYCDETIAPFAAKYGGRTIEFDGSIANVASHGDADTRYDMLIASGNQGSEPTFGPAFKFEDVNVSDLNLTGARIPDSVEADDRFHFVAQVVTYNPDSCLLFLAPVSTRVR
jgi:hypothetical protein